MGGVILYRPGRNVRPSWYAYATYKKGAKMFPLTVAALSIGYTQFHAHLPWDVCNSEVGEIWSFATYEEARAFAKAFSNLS